MNDLKSTHDDSMQQLHQNSHEIKRYLTHLQSHAFMAKNCMHTKDEELADEYFNKHEKTIQLISKLVDDTFSQIYELIDKEKTPPSET